MHHTAVEVVACIKVPVVMKTILKHLEEKAQLVEKRLLPEERGPPQTDLFERL